MLSCNDASCCSAVAARQSRFPDETPYDYMGRKEEWSGFGPEEQHLFANCYIGL